MNILIVGDSWGVGIWNKNSLDTNNYFSHEHHGLAQYLQELGHNVINFSYGGESNLFALRMANLYLQRVSRDIDLIFVFQTEFWRDCKTTEISHLLMENSFEDYINKYKTQILHWYSELAKQFKGKIYMLGGASDTDYYENLNNDFPGVLIGCQSIRSLLLNDNEHPSVPLFSFETPIEFIEFLKNQFQDVENLLNYIELETKMVTCIKNNNKYFYPDKKHPNKDGHLVLLNYLSKKITNLIV